MKIKVFLLLLCMLFVLCFAITLPFCFWYSWLSHVYISLWIWETFWIKENVAVLPRRKVMRWKKKKSWIDLLDEKEKGYLKWLLILTCVGSATIIILNYFFDINIHIQKSIKQNMCIGLVLLAFSIISLLNAFSSKNCRIKKYPIWFYFLPLLTMIVFVILIIAN